MPEILSIVTQPSVIGAIIGLLLLLGIAGKSKMTKNWGIGLIVFGIASLVIAGPLGLSFLNTPLTGGTALAVGDSVVGSVPSQPTKGTLCTVEDTTVTLSAKYKYNATGSGGTHRYRVSDDGGDTFGPALTVADAGTFTTSPNDVVEVLFGNAVTTGFYSVKDVQTIPCSGTKGLSTDVVANGTLSSTLFNEEGDAITGTGSANETLGAGDVVTLTAEFKQAYQTEYPFGATVVIGYNKTSIDDVIWSDESGVEFPTASVPNTYTAIYGDDGTKKAYLIPALISNKKLITGITIDADDTENPISAGSIINMTFYPNGLYINDDKGGAIEGPSAEDEDNVRTRSAGPVVTLWTD